MYRKFGSVVRRENAFVLRVDEAGEAIEDGGSFSCAPIDMEDSRPRQSIESGDVERTAAAIEQMVKPPLILERIIVSEGVAFHEFGDKGWSDRTRRIHLSVAHAPHRALIDLAEFEIDGIARVCNALARVAGEESPRRVRLAENVGAALLPSLVGRLPMQQWAAPHDGKGEWIENVAVGHGRPPNWFRPSYRARPVPAWFHMRADARGEIDRDVPEAIALLSPIRDRTLHVLCVDGDRSFVATIEADDIIAVAPTDRWYPYAAGCFGAEMLL